MLAGKLDILGTYTYRVLSWTGISDLREDSLGKRQNTLKSRPLTWQLLYLPENWTVGGLTWSKSKLQKYCLKRKIEQFLYNARAPRVLFSIPYEF